MKVRAVIALDPVFHQDLPVGVEGIGTRMRELEVLESVVRNDRLKRGESGGQRLLVLAVVSEDEPLPDFRAQRWQSDEALVEPTGPTHVGCPDQVATQIIRPLVIRTDDPSIAVSSAVGQYHSAVTAHGGQDPDFARLIAND